MKRLRLAAILAFAFPIFSKGADPVYANDFESAELGKAPKDFLIIAGAFLVKQEGTNKFLELPGAPLDTFGVLFGPATMDGLSATARFFGTKTGRKFPAFGLSLNGAGGYRLQMSVAKKQLEIFKGDEVRAGVPVEWVDATWTSLRIQARKTPAGAWVIEGKAWPAAGPEPEKWSITLETNEEPAAGRPGLWGNPFSGTPIRIDDIVITPIR